MTLDTHLMGFLEVRFAQEILKKCLKKSTLTLTRSKDSIIYGKNCLHRVVGQSTKAKISACHVHCPSYDFQATYVILRFIKCSRHNNSSWI